jgi:LysM domain
MTAMTVLSIDDAGETAPVRPLTVVPDLADPARRNVPTGPAATRRPAGRVRGTAPGRATVPPGPEVMPSRIIPPRPAGTRRAAGRTPSARPGPAARPAAGSRAARPAAPGPVRLTRRGRVVVGGLAVAVAVAVAFLLSLTLAGGALASSHGAAGAGYRGMHRVVVEPGQTLWSIATAAAPSADPRQVVAQIMSVNSLSGAGIYAGEQLWVPAG